MKRNRELWAALLAIIVVTAVYIPVARTGPPRSSSLVGHSLGVIGFVLMLATETLYSIRKRRRGPAWGRMSTWLSTHIFMGIFGPYLVLLHTAWRFNGLAGVLTLMTLIVVGSGFVGRYIYTAVPRTPSGIEMEAEALNRSITAAEAELRAFLAARPERVQSLAAKLAAIPESDRRDWALVLGRALMEWSYRRQWAREVRRLDAIGKAQAQQLEALLGKRRALQRQLRSLAAARHLLSVWHAVHVPLGMAMFTVAFIHVAATLYLVVLAR